MKLKSALTVIAAAGIAAGVGYLSAGIGQETASNDRTAAMNAGVVLGVEVDAASTTDAAGAGAPVRAAEGGTVRIEIIDLVGPPASSDDGETDAASEEQAARDKMSAPLAAIAAAGGDEFVEIIVNYRTHPELSEDERIKGLGGTVTRS